MRISHISFGVFRFCFVVLNWLIANVAFLRGGVEFF